MRLPNRLQRLVPRIRRCLLTAATLAGYLCATIGFPLPQSTSPSNPCQGQACGCSSELQRLAQCCCHKSCCQQGPAAPSASCCEGSGKPPRSATGVRWVLAFQARSCQGSGVFWFSQNPVPPPPAWVAWSFEWTATGWLTPAPVDSDSPVFPPLSPPPRA
jgi:hypothetical protein